MADINKLIAHLEECSDFIMEKVEKLHESGAISNINDLYMFTDIVKDVSELHKNICKIHKYKAYLEKTI